MQQPNGYGLLTISAVMATLWALVPFFVNLALKCHVTNGCGETGTSIETALARY